MDNIQDKLNSRQTNQVDLLKLATSGCPNAPDVRLGVDNHTKEPLAAIEIESGDEDVMIAFKPDIIEIGVESDDENKHGAYELDQEVEYSFMGELINSVWTGDYESLFNPMLQKGSK